MGVFSKSVSFCRYFVRGEKPAELLAWVEERLRKYPFLDIDDTPEEMSIGWVELGNLLATDFQQSGPHKGEYIVFSLRLDTRQVPPALFRKHYLLAESVKTRQQKSRRLSRDQKAELKETVMQNLLRRQMPQPKLFDVVWNPFRERLWLFTTSPKVREIFEARFRETFELDLYLLFPHTLAMSLANTEVEKNALEMLNPTPIPLAVPEVQG